MTYKKHHFCALNAELLSKQNPLWCMQIVALFAVALTFSFFLFSCTRTECDSNVHVLSTTQVAPVFTGYDTSDLDTVIFSTYTADSSFSFLISQQILTHPDSIENSSGIAGPAYYRYSFDSLPLLHSGYAYKFFIPKTNQTFKIYNIVDTGILSGEKCSHLQFYSYHLTNINITGGNYTMQTSQVTPSFYIFLEK